MPLTYGLLNYLKNTNDLQLQMYKNEAKTWVTAYLVALDIGEHEVR